MPRRRPVNAVISLKFYSDSIAGFAYNERPSTHFLFVLILYLRTVGTMDVLEKKTALGSCVVCVVIIIVYQYFFIAM